MNSYKDNAEPMKYLIPLYLNGQLTDIQKQAFEMALAGSADLEAELEMWEGIDNVYERISQKLPQPSKNTYSRITAKIAEDMKKSRPVSFFRRFMPSSSISLGLIAAQLMIIIVLGAYAASQRSEFRTLSAPSKAQVTATEAIRVNVVFNNNASVKDINELLRRYNANIVEGPKSSGLYVLGVEPQGGINAVLSSLKKSGIVVMAEKAYQ